MNATDKIVCAALLRYRKVYLPEAGTLYIEYKSAKKVSRQLFMPPCSSLAFTERRLPGAPSVIALTVSQSRLSEPQARELYAAWLKEARSDDGSIRIAGVGTVSAKGVETDQTFGRMLNPAGTQFVKIKTRKKGAAAAAASVAAIAVAAACFWGISEYSPAEVVPAPEAICSLPPEPVPVSVPDSAAVTQEKADTTASPQTDTPAEHSEIHYIIAGTFSVEENADRYLAQLQEKFPDIECGKIRLSSKRWMVSVASTPDADKARRLLSELRYVKSDLWIHTAALSR